MNGIGIFKEVRDDPKYRIEPLFLDNASLDHAVVLNNRIVSSQGMSSITFALPEPQHVFAVRLRYAYVHTTNLWPTLHVSWRNSAFQDFDDRRTFVSTVPGPDQSTWALVDGKIHTDAKVRTDRTLTVWIDAEVDHFRIYPDSAPCELRLSGIELLERPD